MTRKVSRVAFRIDRARKQLRTLATALKSPHEICDSRFGSTEGDDAQFEAVVAVNLKCSFDGVDDPFFAVSKDASAEQGEIDDVVAGSGRVEDGGGQRCLVGRIENQLGEVGPLVGRLPAVRNGQCRAIRLRDSVAGTIEGDFGVELQFNSQMAEQGIALGSACRLNRLRDPATARRSSASCGVSKRPTAIRRPPGQTRKSPSSESSLRTWSGEISSIPVSSVNHVMSARDGSVRIW